MNECGAENNGTACCPEKIILHFFLGMKDIKDRGDAYGS
jgi:hypothetical protein